MFDYHKFINEHSIEFGSCPFWSWNDKLEAGELKRQIDDMKQSGMRGFFMHARGGLQTEYFSDEWFHMIRVCVDYAKEQGMQAWVYDENGWPSGFANRKLLEDKRHRSSYLKLQYVEEFPNIVTSDSYSNGVLAVYEMSSGKPKRLTTPNNNEKYICITRNYEDSYVDVLNPDVSILFLDSVYAEYKKRFPEDFGQEYMPGFFTDEPQYFRYATPWSNVLLTAFYDKYGYDVLDILPALFLEYEGACEERYDYWNLLHEMFMQNWIRPIYEWCEANHCKLTGHAIEESALFTQMWCCGGVMPFYEYEHIPGVDHLGRGIDPGLEAKQIGSVAAQLGKKRVLAEIFGCTGCDATPRELKSVVDSMYVEGVNLICQHLYPYSSRGERKYDHPIHFSDLLPWNNHMSDMNYYFNKLGCLLSLGTDATNILVLHPMHSAYLYFRREEDRDSVAALETAFMSCLNQLWNEQLLFHLGDETLISKYGSVQGDRFVIGNCTYDAVIMPDMDTIDSATTVLLQQYIQNGGKLLCMGKTPNYKDGRRTKLMYESNITLQELKAQQSIRVKYCGEDQNRLKVALRIHEQNKIFYLTNLTDHTMTHIEIYGMSRPHVLDLTDFSLKMIPQHDMKLQLHLQAHESCIIIDADLDVNEAVPETFSSKRRMLDKQFELVQPAENFYVLDAACVSMDGIVYGEKKPITQISQELLEVKYEGEVWLKFDYLVSEKTSDLHLLLEPQKYSEVTLNGEEQITKENDWRIDRRFAMYDIAQQTQIGKNEIVVSFEYRQNQDVYDIYFGNGTESLRNCMSFETEISPVYLMGDFKLQSVHTDFWEESNAFCHNGDFSLMTQENTIDLSNLTVSGYPFFFGSVKAKQTFMATELTKEICIEGRYSVCEVWVNGVYAGSCMFQEKVDISNHIVLGENELMLVLYSSARNIVGPFHYKEAEPVSVFPAMFKFENQWRNGICAAFRERYSFALLGVRVCLIEEDKI